MAKVSIIPWIVKKMKKCLGITEDTNTASRSISSGDYVIWKGDAYKASSSISEGDTLSSSNLTAVTDGVGNDLKQAVANKPDYATEMPMSSSDATKVSQAIATLNDKITENNINVLPASSGITCRYVVRSGYCYLHLNGTASSTSNITFTVPKPLLGCYETVPQWGQNTNIMQVYIDANTTTLTIRNHALTSINVSMCYPVM